MASEMGVAIDEFLDMSWQEYQYMKIGYERRVEREWDIARHLMATMYNSSGMSKRKVDAKSMMRLNYLDRVSLDGVTLVPESTKDFLINRYKEMRNGN